MRAIPALVASALYLVSSAALAAVAITGVAPWSSGISPVSADWFELTNKGSSAVYVSGWRMDDSSLSFGSARALRGITAIGAGRSVILIESDAAGRQDGTLPTPAEPLRLRRVPMYGPLTHTVRLFHEFVGISPTAS